MQTVRATPHQSVGIEEDAQGFYVPRCACGWSFGPVPDLETFIDVLMAHAAEASGEEGGGTDE